MTKTKKIHTGTYIFGSHEANYSFGGVSAMLSLPSYSSKIDFFINNNYESTSESFDNAKLYNFDLSELEAMHSAMGRAISYLKNLESLAKKNLLRDEAYHEEE